MGVSQLGKLIRENARKGYQERPLSYYHGKKIAIDAPMSIYQFLIAIRADGETLGAEKKTTSHLVGMFYRTISIIESGINPLFIFDGASPEVKINEILKRRDKREEALEKYNEAKEEGDREKMTMYDKRKTKITTEHIEDCRKLLELMGVPSIVAPSEAEAYCSFLASEGIVDAVATEDMDALAFGAPVLLRNVTASRSKKLPIQEYKLEKILKDLEMTQKEFVDLCILLGCDFCETIKGVGPKTALNLIKEFGSIEEIIKNRKKCEIPQGFNYQSARLVFQNLAIGDVVSIGEIRWDSICRDSIKNFLVGEHGFNEERVEKGVQRLLASKKTKGQATLDSFFGGKK